LKAAQALTTALTQRRVRAFGAVSATHPEQVLDTILTLFFSTETGLFKDLCSNLAKENALAINLPRLTSSDERERGGGLIRSRMHNTTDL
jgi:hypothetical protein